MNTKYTVTVESDSRSEVLDLLQPERKLSRKEMEVSQNVLMDALEVVRVWKDLCEHCRNSGDLDKGISSLEMSLEEYRGLYDG